MEKLEIEHTPEDVQDTEQTAVTVVWKAVAEVSALIRSNVDEGAKRIYDVVCGGIHSVIGSDQGNDISGEDYDLDLSTCSYDLDGKRNGGPDNWTRYEARASAWYLDEQSGVIAENWMVHETDPDTPTTVWRIVSQRPGRATERIPSITSMRKYY